MARQTKIAAEDDKGAEPLGLYIHIPFCERKCPYCDFNTYAGLESLYDDLVETLCTELERRQALLGERRISTLFIGGGTPTVLNSRALAQILETVRRCCAVEDDAEITCEANPGAVDRAKFRALRDLGVNRLSMGVQSFQADELHFLGRIHSVADVHRAWDAARAAGFDNINLDFMFGLPGQSCGPWTETLRQALDLGPEHLSLYSLIVEEETPLHHWVETGLVAVPDDDIAAEQYEVAMQLLGDAGYAHYEVSNWARVDCTKIDGEASITPHFACRHNLIYWRNQEYLGIGPGAHSHLTSRDVNDNLVERRWGNHRPVAGYVGRVRGQENVEAFSEVIEPATSMGETMMLGLRLLREGVSEENFSRRYGVDMAAVFGEKVAKFEDWHLLEKEEGRVRLTRRGTMVGNRIFADFLPDADDDASARAS